MTCWYIGCISSCPSAKVHKDCGVEQAREMLHTQVYVGTDEDYTGMPLSYKAMVANGPFPEPFNQVYKE